MITDISCRGRAYRRRQENAAIWEIPEIKIPWYRDESSNLWKDKRDRLARREAMRPLKAAWYSKRVGQAAKWYHQVWQETRTS
jgi:hypothetical protein